MTWIGFNTFLKFHLRQLRTTLGFPRCSLAFAPRHTKEVAYKTLVRPKLEYAAPIWHPYHETQIGQVEKVQRTAARWTCRRWRNNINSVGDMLDELEWPSLETRREQSSLTFFYKIHSGTVSLDKDKYLTPAPKLRRTRAPHESQYTRYFAYSDALKISFPPGLSLCGIVFPLQWSHLRLLRSLRLRFRLLIQLEVCVLACLCTAQLLVNSFNGPSRMFFPLAKFII